MTYEAYNAMRQMNNLSSPQSYYQNQNQTILNAKFDQGINVYQVYFNNSATPTNVRILDKDSDMVEQKTILVKGMGLNFGDIINWNGIYYMVDMVDIRGGNRQRGTILRCLSSIKWLNSNGQTKEAYFIIYSRTQRSLGMIDGGVLIEPNERRYIAVQNNADTLQIKKGQRFIFDNNRSWRVSSINTLITGLIEYEMEERDIDPARDRVDLRIADYTQNPSPTGGNLW